jgi:hypothetical protein
MQSGIGPHSEIPEFRRHRYSNYSAGDLVNVWATRLASENALLNEIKIKKRGRPRSRARFAIDIGPAGLEPQAVS